MPWGRFDALIIPYPLPRKVLVTESIQVARRGSAGSAMTQPQPVAVYVTTSPAVTDLVNARLCSDFSAAVQAKDVVEELPWLYASTVIFFFPEGLPAGSDWLREYNQIFRSGEDRVHNSIAVAGLECEHALFISSAGDQGLVQHGNLLAALQREMEALLGRHVAVS